MAAAPVPFEALGRRAQVNRLRATATEALARYPIEVTSLRLIDHEFNTTFRVDTADGRRFALRLNVNSRRDPAHVRAEVAWVDALVADTDLGLPVPLRTIDGELTTTVDSPDLGRALPAVLYSWLPGRDIGSGGTPEQLREAGRAIAILHDHADGWSLPPGAELPRIDHPLMNSPNRFATSDHPLLTERRRAILDAAMAEITSHAEVLDQPVMAIHADVHRGNLKWHRGRLWVFDFDDCGLGVPIQDFAIAAYYLRDDAALEAALLEGYAAHRPLPAWTDRQYEAMVAGRCLMLLNEVLTWVTAGAAALLAHLVPNTASRLEHYLETGRFRRNVPGLVEG